MKSTWTTILFVAAALAVGCGGGDPSAKQDPVLTYQVEASTTMDTADPPLTREQFVAKMNRICREAWGTVYDNWRVYTGNQDPGLDEKARFDDAVRRSLLAGIVFHIFDDYRQLGAPTGEERRLEGIIGPFQAAAELGWAEEWTAHSIADIPPHFDIYNRRAGRYGLDDCLVDEAHLRPVAKLSPAL